MDTIASGVHQLSLGSNAFIVEGDEGLTLVDTGMPNKEGLVEAALTRLGRSFDDVVAIVATHAHVDHVGSARALRAATGAPVAIGVKDAPVARGEATATAPPLLDRFGIGGVVARVLPTADPVVVDHAVSEADRDGLPGDLQVLDTPGHTVGHVSWMLDRAGGVLFVGDAAMSTRRGGVGRGIMNRKEPKFDASIVRLSQVDCTVAVFGHAAPITSGAGSEFRRFAATLA